MPPPVNAIDLTTLTAVRNIVGAVSTASDQTLQDCITAFSAWALTLTGRGPMDGSIPATSPLASIVSYNETYDGNGSPVLFLRNTPIQAVSALTVSGLVIPLSSAWGVKGYVISGDKKSLKMRSGGGGSGPSFSTTNFGAVTGAGLYFVRDIQNVNVVYTAGYAAVPFDLEMCARKVVALNYKRFSSIGQKSQAMAQGAGTVSFGQWEMDDDCRRTMTSYKRTAMV